MKTKIRLLRRFIPALFAGFIALFALDAKGQNITSPPVITNVDFPSIGTPEKIEAFAVHTVNRIYAWAWAYKTNGTMVGLGSVDWYGSFGPNPYIYGPLTNKAQLDWQCRSNISTALNYLMTNSDSSIDKSQGLTVNVDCQAYSGLPSLDTFYSYHNRYYLGNSNGSYTLPDLSSFSTQINPNIPLYLPGLQWARYEIYYAGYDYPLEVDDGLLDPATDPIDSDGFLDLPTGYMSSSSSTNGEFWVKTSAFTQDGFGVWNGDGKPVKTPMIMDIATNNSGMLVTVNGGSSGLGYVIQWSPDLAHWTNSIPLFFSPVPESLPPQFGFPNNSAKMFFRTVVTNLPPQ